MTNKLDGSTSVVTVYLPLFVDWSQKDPRDMDCIPLDLRATRLTLVMAADNGSVQPLSSRKKGGSNEFQLLKLLPNTSPSLPPPLTPHPYKALLISLVVWGGDAVKGYVFSHPAPS